MPAHRSQYDPLPMVPTWRPSAIRPAPIGRFHLRSLTNGMDMMIETPMRWSTPNTTYPLARASQVASEMPMPSPKMTSPRRRFRWANTLNGILVASDFEKVRDSETPTSMMKMAAPPCER